MTDDSITAPLPVPPLVTATSRYPWYHWRRLGFNFLTISLLAHLLFAVVAAYFVVQTIHAPRQQNFAGGPKGDNAPKRAIEHKVQMQRKQQSMSAPAAKRVTTTGLSKVSLPTMPAMPTDATVTPLSMAGMSGGAGLGFGKGGGGGGAGGGGGGGGGLSMFGLRTGGVGLAGTFYDLKQTPNKQPTNMTPEQYGKIIADFGRGGFNLGLLARFYKSDKPIYTTQIWIPNIKADLGPAAFQLENEVQPKMWCVVYRGKVVAPESFTFHFVGAGDDVMMVKFNGKLVLERNWYNRFGWRPQANYDYGFTGIKEGFAKGDAITVVAGQNYSMEVIIGEQPGGSMFATLLQEVDGAPYDKDSKGNPVLPVFRMSGAAPAADEPGRKFPPHRNDGPVWKPVSAASSDSSSIFSH